MNPTVVIGLLAGAREVHATTVRITKEQGNRLGAPWRFH